MPKDWTWPTNNDGWPLAFIAQIALEELPKIGAMNLPRKGSLFFFYDGESWGYDPKDADSCRVLYSPDKLSSFRAHSLPEDELEHQFAPVRIKADRTEPTIPSGRDSVVESFNMTQEERSAYFDFEDDWNKQTPYVRHRVGGHPDLIQGDARLEAHLVSHGIYCGDGDGYKKGKERGLFPGAADWQLLLQVDSEEKAEMQWGDGGRIYFFIHKDDLAARRFEKVRLILQCY